MLEGLFTAFGTLLVIIVILYLAYIATKYVGKGDGFRQYLGSSRHITMIDQVVLGQGMSVAVVKVSERVFLLGVTSNQISLLAEFEDGEWLERPSVDTDIAGSLDFKDIISKIKDRKR